jgi:hypothetical protein
MAYNKWVPNKGSGSNFYQPVETEVNLRREMYHTMYGHFPELPKGQMHIFRKMRRDANLNLLPCPCTSSITQEPDLDFYCPICMGEGYYWDEQFFEGYKVVVKSDVGNAQREKLLSPGLINIPIVTFYTKADLDFTLNDRIVEIIRDHEGKPIQPYKRKYIYRIDAPIDLRSDHGRLEYWKLACYSMQRKFLNGPLG